MALKQLILSNKLAKLALRRKGMDEKKKEQESRKADLTLRSEKVRKAFEELQKREDAPTEEEQTAVDEELAQVEADVAALEAEEAETDAEITALENEVADLQQQLDAIQEQVEEVEAEVEAPAEDETRNKKRSAIAMNHRKFFGISEQETAGLFARSEMKQFVSTIRAAYKEKRAITNAGLLIPDVLLPILRQQTQEYSKLMKHVNVRNVPGTSRQNIMGDIPEAVWTEMCANLNELALTFNSVELDGYKVGGFIAVCNAILEDASDVALATEVLTAIAKAIGYALDKAILYGTGTKMPTGIMTRLVQTSAPSGYPATARPWVNLSTTNVTSIPATTKAAALFQAIIEKAGAMSHKYASEGKFWAMNEKTHMRLVAEALTINAAGAIVSGIDNTMPILGGAIEELDFVPDNVIIAGYGENYLLAERAGTSLDTSEHVRFIQDQTVFRGTARYDGTPVIPEAFVAIGLNAVTPDATMTFAADSANP